MASRSSLSKFLLASSAHVERVFGANVRGFGVMENVRRGNGTIWAMIAYTSLLVAPVFGQQLERPRPPPLSIASGRRRRETPEARAAPAPRLFLPFRPWCLRLGRGDDSRPRGAQSRRRAHGARAGVRREPRHLRGTFPVRRER